MGAAVKRLRVELDDEDLLRRLEAARAGHPSRKYHWTPTKDQYLLKYWPTRNKRDIAAAFGCDETTARNRYNELTREVKS